MGESPGNNLASMIDEPFVPAELVKGAHYRVKETFYASGACVRAGWVVRVDWVTLRIEERIYDLSIGLTPTEPPGGTIIWGRSHPLEQRYVDQILERVS
jgi:hypothetical protein